MLGNASRTTLRVRLLAMVVVGGVAVLGVTGIGLRGLEEVGKADAQVAVFREALVLNAAVEASRERVRADVLVTQLGGSSAARAGVDVAGASASYERLVERQATLPLPAALSAELSTVSLQSNDFTRAAIQLSTGRASAQQLSEFLTSFAALQGSRAAVAVQLQDAANRHERVTAHSRSSAVRVMILAGMLGVLALAALASVIARSVVRTLSRVGDVAEAMAAGDLSARTGLRGSDEVGRLAGSFDAMADGLQALLLEQMADAERQGFGNRLTAALEHADETASVLDVASRAMDAAAPGLPAELLLSNASMTHLGQAASSPESGRAGCDVAEPKGCPAMRSGQTLQFASSDALDACPKLREHADGGRSAVCVPVTFIGSPLGVLHAVGAPGGIEAATVLRMRTLAALTGTRLGTVRALASAELQASTDALTGLMNRRRVEQQLGVLLASHTPYSIAVADLDHFKQINDTHGHEAGDRALRIFAATMTAAVRSDDLVGRWGGEEFVLVFPQTPLLAAAELCGRLQQALAAALSESACPPYTVSFGMADSLSGRTVEEQLRVADAALLTAKAAGRNQVVIGGAEGVERRAQLVPAQAGAASARG